MKPSTKRKPRPTPRVGLTCRRCIDQETGKPYQWAPRNPRRPRRCPGCGTKYWDKPRE